MIELLAQGVQVLAGQCDGAFEHDGAGFNRFDAQFGHQMATRPAEEWTDRQVASVYRMLRKYKGQLAAAGIDIESIPAPEAGEETRGTVSVAGPLFVVRFEYDKRIVEAVKQLAGRAFVPNGKYWTVPQSARAEVAEFARAHGLRVDEDAAAVIEGRVAPQAYNPKVVEFDGMFTIRFPYQKEIVDDVRRIFGAAWDSVGRRWMAPEIAAPDVRQFADKHGFSIQDAAAAAFSLERADLTEESQAYEAEFEVAGLGRVLRPFQRAGVRYLTTAKRAICADEMGLGKTVQALAAIHHEGAYPAVVVCPASLKHNWAREAMAWLPGKTVAIWTTSYCRPADVVIVNYDIVGKLLDVILAVRPQALVCDESHYLKNRKAKRTQAVRMLAGGCRFEHEKGPGEKRTKKVIKQQQPALETVILLTGTPVMNRPEELKPQLEIIRRIDDLGGEAMFDRRYAYTSNAERLAELHQRLRQMCFIRRKKDEVLKELPAKVRTTITFELGNAQEYRYAEREFLRWLREKEGQSAADKAAAAETLVQIGKLKQLAVAGKMRGVKAWVDDFLQTGEKLVLFADHIAVQQALEAEFRGCARINGSDPNHVRQANVDRFQTEEDCRLIVVSLKAGREGHTLTAASNVAFVELGWNPAAHDQAEDRCHRIGQRDSVTVWYLLAEDSIDIEIAELIDRKRAIVNAVTDGEEAAAASITAELVRAFKQKAGIEVEDETYYEEAV